MIIKDKLGNDTKYDWDTFIYDPFDPDTFLWLLEELDFPYLENEYMHILYKYISKRKGNPLAKYVGLMRLCSFKFLHWEDSYYTEDARRYVLKSSPLVVEVDKVVDYLAGGRIPVYLRVEPLRHDCSFVENTMDEVH